MFDEIEGNVDGIIPLENVVQYLTIMSQDNRKIKVKVIIGSLLEDYKDVQIDLKKFTVKIENKTKYLWLQAPSISVYLQLQCFHMKTT